MLKLFASAANRLNCEPGNRCELERDISGGRIATRQRRGKIRLTRQNKATRELRFFRP